MPYFELCDLKDQVFSGYASQKSITSGINQHKTINNVDSLDYFFNSHINTPKSKSNHCAADYGTKLQGNVCCGQPGKLDNMKYACPPSRPICKGYKYNKHWGKCFQKLK